MGIFRFDRDGPDRRVRGEAERARGWRRSAAASRPARPFAAHAADKPFIASMGIYVFSRDVLLDMLEQDGGTDFGREIIPAALGRYRVNALPVPRLLGRRRHDRRRSTTRTSCSTRPDAPFTLLRSAAADLHAPAPFLPGARSTTASVRDGRSSPRAATLDSARHRGIGRRHPDRRAAPDATIRARCCSAPTSTRPTTTRRRRGGAPRLGIGRDVVLDRVIVDKNARIGDGAGW